MTTRARSEDGAALILALIFVTVVGVGAMVLASLGFSSQQAAAVYTGKERLVNALDSGIQAAIENARATRPFACPARVELPPVNEHRVFVDCEIVSPAATPEARAQLRFTASTYCPQLETGIVGTVAYSRIGDAATGAAVARTIIWKVGPVAAPDPPACPPAP